MSWGRTGNLKGPPGDDAFAVAKQAGFSGTREQWLASLKGKDGQTGPAWFTGSGAPGAIDGAKTGDFFIDVDSGDLYRAQ